MALAKQNFDVTFRGGVDSKSDPKQVISVKLLALENGRLQSTGRLKKRYGYLALGNAIEGGTFLTAGSALAVYGSELLQFSGSELYSYSASTQKWSDKGFTTSCELSTFPVVRNSYQQTTCDSAIHSSGLRVFTWEDSRASNTIRYSVVDSSTGQFIVNDGLISATGLKPKPMALGNYIVISFLNSSNNHIQYCTISVVTPSVISAAVDVAINVNASNPNWDCCALGARIFYAYNNTDGGGGISAKYLNAFLTLSAAATVAETASGVVTIFPDSANNQLWIAYYNGTAVKYFIRDYTLTVAVLAATSVETVANVRNLCGIATAGTAKLFYSVTAAASYNYLTRSASLTSGGSVSGAGVFLRSVGLASKPFTQGGINYVVVAFQSALQPTYFVASSTGKIIAKVAPSVGGGLTAKNILPEVNSVSSTQFLFAYLKVDNLTTSTGVVQTQTGVQAALLSFGTANCFLRGSLASTLHVSGGLLQMYDGNSVVEHGFHLFPESATVTPSTTGGNIPAGTYGVCFCYEWTDAQGQIHRSAPSVAQSVTWVTGTTNRLSYVVPTLRLTSKAGTRSPVTIAAYRTATNGTVYYRVSSTTAPVANDTTVDTVTLPDDTIADPTGNALLYTTGSVLENIPAPAANLVFNSKSRLIVVDAENRLSWWPSKQVVQGAPVEFSDFTTQAMDPFGGDIVAGAAMDDKIIFFKRPCAFYVYGDGPDNNGGGGFSDPELITTAQTGCTNPRSVILTPQGLMRQTDKGIYLLDRALNDVYIGADVEAYNSDTVTAAALIPNTTEVRFYLASGTVLVYDYFNGQWATDKNITAVDAVVFQSQATYLQSNGTVLEETTGSYTDNGNFIKLRARLAWLSLAGIQGFQRIYGASLLGEYASAHKLQVQVAYDFNPNPTQTSVIDATTLIGTSVFGSDPTFGASTVFGGPYPSYQFGVSLAQQKCNSIQFTIEDVQSSNFGEGYSLSALSLEVGLKRGTNKLPAARTV